MPTRAGVLAEAGPRGSLQIATLSGELRGRPIAGEGDVEFAAPSTLVGDLRVSSGKSRISVKGSSADRNEIDATVDLAVASLGDWVPDTQGSLTGHFTVRGVWPKLNIAGTADGKSLGHGREPGCQKLHVDATVANPLDPDGKVQAVATQVTVGGRQFAQVTLDASGNQAKHRVAVSADSERFDGAVELAGGLTKTGWRGDLVRPAIHRAGYREPHAARAFARRVRVGQVFTVADVSGGQADGVVFGHEVRSDRASSTRGIPSNACR